MRKILWTGAAAALLALAACDPGSSGVTTATAFTDEPIVDANGHSVLVPNSDPAISAREAELLRLVNDYRLMMNLQPLLPLTRLGDAARAHSRHMIEHRFVAHATPEGLLAGDRLSLVKVDWTAAAENIATAFSTPQDVFDAWLKSPLHRANIESDRFTHAAVGYQIDRNPTAEFADIHYWAMAFLQR
jgi:uncharacterized protein YkwD